MGRINLFKNRRCLNQKKAKEKVLNGLEEMYEKVAKNPEEDSLYISDLTFEIRVLKCKKCKVTLYRDGSWIDEYCDEHYKESETL
jgi:hypothetical protein